jgi:hypothetical protein
MPSGYLGDAPFPSDPPRRGAFGEQIRPFAPVDPSVLRGRDGACYPWARFLYGIDQLGDGRRTVERHPARPAGGDEECLVDVRSVEVGTADRVVVEVRPVEVSTVDRHTAVGALAPVTKL